MSAGSTIDFMYKVLITDYLTGPPTIEQEQLAGIAAVDCLLAKSHQELIGKVNDADGLIVFHEVTIPSQVIDVLERCRVVVRGGVGFDGVDLAAAGRRGICVCNVPDYAVDEVADHAIGLMLACNRGLMRADRRLRQSLSPWNYHAVEPIFRLSEATMGIIGLGRIGTATALRARALKMRVLACDPYIRPGIGKAVGVQMADLDAVLADSDVVSLHVPLTDETHGMIDADALDKMKPHAILVNTARGAVVDVDALTEALRSKRIAAAGIDVLPTEPPEPSSRLIQLWRESTDRPVNLVITPHSAFYSESSLIEVRVKAAQEVARVLQGKPPRSCVNRQYLS
jgi:C-terminal binding protein